MATDKTTTADKKEKVAPKQVKAFARYIQVSPQKMRLVADLVRHQPVDLALEQLRFSSKNAALPLAKAINSAIANAVHNFNLRKEDLYIKTLSIDGGPVLDRYKPRAYGRPGAIRRRTSHINVILEERKRTGKKANRSIFAAIVPKRKKDDEKHEHEHDHDHDTSEPKIEDKQQVKSAPKSEEKLKQNKVSLKRRLFNRKSGQ